MHCFWNIANSNVQFLLISEHFLFICSLLSLSSLSCLSYHPYLLFLCYLLLPVMKMLLVCYHLFIVLFLLLYHQTMPVVCPSCFLTDSTQLISSYFRPTLMYNKNKNKTENDSLDYLTRPKGPNVLFCRTPQPTKQHPLFCLEKYQFYKNKMSTIWRNFLHKGIWLDENNPSPCVIVEQS